jgi:hypothetical protein
MARRARRKLSVLALALALVAGLVWQFTPAPAVWAIRSLSDPANLATLGKRGANPRLNKIVFWLAEAQDRGLSPDTAIDFAQRLNGTGAAQAELVKHSLLRNLRIAGSLGLLTPANRGRLRRGQAAIVTTGPCAGDEAEVDHIVPVSLAPEAGNDLSNLELMPARINRAKSNRVGERQLDHAEALFEAKLISAETLARLRAAAARN